MGRVFWRSRKKGPWNEATGTHIHTTIHSSHTQNSSIYLPKYSLCLVCTIHVHSPIFITDLRVHEVIFYTGLVLGTTNLQWILNHCSFKIGTAIYVQIPFFQSSRNKKKGLFSTLWVLNSFPNRIEGLRNWRLIRYRRVLLTEITKFRGKNTLRLQDLVTKTSILLMKNFILAATKREDKNTSSLSHPIQSWQ